MKRVAVALLAFIALTACGGGADNTDPRKGVVVIDEESCLSGGCYRLAKYCLGPDLHIDYDESGDDDYSRVDENSPECEVAS